MSLFKRALPFFMWSLPLTFFTFQFVLRLWPGLMMKEVMGQFNIDASHFGMMAAFYYYGYAGMQIPVAVLLDRYGARYVLFGLAVLCGLSTLVFTYTDNFYLAVFSRFLVGVGSAAGFLGTSKVISEWFPKEQYSKMVGFSFTVGLMGAIYGGKPVSLLIEQYNFQSVSVALAAVSILLGLGAYLFLRSPDTLKSKEEGDAAFTWANFKAVLSSPVIWMLAFANLLMVGALEGFADVWGVQYLMTAYEIHKSDAAGIVSMTFFGMLFGGPLLAFFSRKLGNYTVIASCGLGMSLAFALLLACSHQYHGFFLSSLFFLVGVMCCYQVIVFAAGAELSSLQNLGVTVAFLNCINMLGGSFFHTLIGNAMDMLWTGTIDAEGLKLYDLSVFKYALSLIPIAAAVGALIVCGIALRATTSLRKA